MQAKEPVEVKERSLGQVVIAPFATKKTTRQKLRFPQNVIQRCCFDGMQIMSEISKIICCSKVHVVLIFFKGFGQSRDVIISVCNKVFAKSVFLVLAPTSMIQHKIKNDAIAVGAVVQFGCERRTNRRCRFCWACQ